MRMSPVFVEMRGPDQDLEFEVLVQTWYMAPCQNRWDFGLLLKLVSPDLSIISFKILADIR